MRICLKGQLLNLHLVAIPMFDRHTALSIFNKFFKFLDALYSKWCSKLIGMSSDGENTVTNTRVIKIDTETVLQTVRRHFQNRY
jgi:hypothetical protein